MLWEELLLLLAQTQAAAPQAGLQPAQSLTLALTAESLMFAAFSVSYNLAQPTDEGRHPFYAQGIFSYVIVFAIFAAAVSAGASWYAVYEPDWPSGYIEWMRAVGVAIAIALQPFFGLAIANQARNS